MKKRLRQPSRISQTVLERGIQTNTAYEIVSIDIAIIDVGRNIGARLQSDEAEAETRVARAEAEVRRAEAVADEHEMKALVSAKQAKLVLAEAEIPKALAEAIRRGQFPIRIQSNSPNGWFKTKAYGHRRGDFEISESGLRRRLLI